MLPRLHVITDDATLAAPDFIARARALLDACGSQVALHLRGRATPARQLYELGALLVDEETPLFINDRVDLALALGADGIQLRADSIPVPAARALLPDALIGYSAHTAAECVDAAGQGADFVLAGTIFRSQSHPEGAPQGPAFLAQIAGRAALPVIAIGGIDAGNAAECQRAGAYGVAAIRAVWHASDATAAAQRILAALQQE